MIWTWIFVLIGVFSTSIIYFELSGPVMSLLDTFVTYGAPQATTDDIKRAYHAGYIILTVGLILYGLINSFKTEPDSYKKI